MHPSAFLSCIAIQLRKCRVFGDFFWAPLAGLCLSLYKIHIRAQLLGGLDTCNKSRIMSLLNCHKTLNMEKVKESPSQYCFLIKTVRKYWKSLNLRTNKQSDLDNKQTAEIYLELFPFSSNKKKITNKFWLTNNP